MPGRDAQSTRSAEHLWGLRTPKTLLLVTIVLGVLASGCTIAVVDPSISFEVPKIASAVAIVVWLLTPFEVTVWRAGRIWTAHPAETTLHRSAWGRLISLPIIAAAGFVFPSSQLSDNLFTAGALCFFLSRVRLGQKLRELVPELPPDPVETVGITGVFDGAADGPLHRAVRPRSPERPHAVASQLSRRQLPVAAACLLVLGVAGALTGIGDGLGWATGRWSRHAASNGHVGTGGNGRSGTGGKGHGSDGGGSNGHGSGDGGGGTGNGGGGTDGSTAPCSVAPQEGIPLQVIEAFQALYAGAHQLGPKQTGCPSEIFEESTPEGVLYWTLGKRHGDPEPTSLAVVPPKRFHNAIVLSPAVRYVEVTIKKGWNVGGPRRFPRYYVGGGDIYVIDTERGTVVLAQEETGTASKAPALVPMPVSAAFAWLSLTNETKVWRWPIELRTPRGIKLFGLKQAGKQLSHYRIKYYDRIDVDRQKAAETAERNAEAGPWDEYISTQNQINPVELRRWAPLAPREEREREEEEESPEERRELEEATKSASG